MVLFLRDERNNSIVDLECYVKTGENDPKYKYVELSVTVDIQWYSLLLLQNLDRKIEIISDFSEIQELRGWLWENYFMGGNNDPEKYGDVIAELRKMLLVVAKKYDLGYVED